MAVYMIDYENVKTGGLNGISRLTDTDRVIIFYSENANRLTFDLHQRLMASTAQIEYREVSVGGHNALDFQLVTYLGFLIAQNPNGQYLIISNDRGFEYVVNFWRKDGLSIGLLPYLKDPAYALQKATRFDAKPVGAPAEAEEEIAIPEETVAEEAVQATEEPAAEEPAGAGAGAAAAMIAEPIAEETASPAETVFEETVTATSPVAEEPNAEPEAAAEAAKEPAVAATPVEILPERRKPSQQKKKRGGASEEGKKDTPKKQDKPSEGHGKQLRVAPAAQAEEVKPASALSEPMRAELRAMLGDSVADDPELRFVLGCVEKYKTKLGLNNALVKRFGNQKASEIYQKLKPLLSAKKTAGDETKPKAAASKPKQPKKEKAAVS